MADISVAVKLVGQAAGALNAISGVQRSLSSLGSAASGPIKAVGKLSDVLGSLFFAKGGLDVLANSAKALGNTLGIGLASELEMVRAQLLAFMKDGAAVDALLVQIREEANRTPFAFQEMAKATAMLQPAAQASGRDIMELIRQAEILAALNPAEGLTGAAFSLREALSGDFVSVMERFNIPRTLINRLKDEGVPAMEIVGRALQEMGADYSLVANLAQTTAGRLSTFQDAIDTLRVVAGQPILAALGTQLDRLAGFLTDNEAQLTELALTIGTTVADAIAFAAQTFMDAWPTILEFARSLREAYVAAQPVITSVLEALVPAIANFATLLRDVVIPTVAQWVAQLVATALELASMWQATWSVVSAVVETAWAILGPLFGALGAALGAFGERLLPEFQQSWQETTTTVRNLWNAFSGAIVAAVANFRELWEADWMGIQTILTAAWEAMKLIMGLAWDTMQALVLIGINTFQGDWQGVWDAITQYFGSVWERLKEFASRGIEWIIGKVQPLVDVVRGVVDTINSLLGGIRLPDFGGLVNAAQDAANAAKDALGGISIPGRQFGGSVLAGLPYLVGERGPELFVPATSGHVLPNTMLASAGTLAGGMGTAGLTVHVHFSGPTYGVREIEDVVVASIEQARRRGRV